MMSTLNRRLKRQRNKPTSCLFLVFFIGSSSSSSSISRLCKGKKQGVMAQLWFLHGNFQTKDRLQETAGLGLQGVQQPNFPGGLLAGLGKCD